MKGWIKAMGLTAVMAASPAMASEVNQANVNTFSGGNAALASEVNENFTALIAAIDDNAQRIQQLESSSASGFEISGKTYQLYILAPEMDGSGNPELIVENATVTFNADGTASLSGEYVEGLISERTLSDGTVESFVDVVRTAYSDGPSWTKPSTGQVTIGGDLTLNIAPGARMLLSQAATPNFTTETQGFKGELFIAVQMP